MTPADIKSLRERSGLTQAAFARAYGVPVRTLQDWEHDRRKPDGAALSLLRAIAAAPDVMRELLA
jgi:putative transcriptional regulator